MLTGKELGSAIDRAITLKGVTKKAFADAMGVKPASVQDWVKYGRVAKSRIEAIVEYFNDVTDLEFWGLGYIRTQAGIGKSSHTEAVVKGAVLRKLATNKQYKELSEIIHGASSGTSFSLPVASIARAAMEAEALGVPPEKLAAIHKILIALRDAQKAVSGATREINNVVADAELPSDKEVEAALADLGLQTDRGAVKDGRSTNRGHHRKSG